MANITRQNIAPLIDKITVQLTKADYLPNFEKALKTYSKQVKMQGFRPGQVPMGLIKKMHGAGIFNEEVLKLVEKEINAYLTQENPEIFAQPLPTEDNDEVMATLNMNEPADFNFSFEIGLRGAYTLPDLSQAIIKRNIVTVTEKMLEEEIAKLQTKHGIMTEPETVTNDECVLNILFKEIDTEGNAIEAGIEKENSLLVKYFSETIRPTLMGLKIGDSFKIKLNEAFEDKELEWMLSDLGLSTQQANTHFLSTITKIGLVQKAELNEEFFNKIYEGKAIATQAEFEAALKESITAYWLLQDRGNVNDQIFDYLLSNTAMQLPEDFLKRWIRKGGEKQKTAEEAETEWPSFQKSLRWTLISERLIAENKIEVDPEEIKMFARQQMMGYMGGQTNPADMPWLDTYIEKMTKDQKFVENTYNQIATDKLFAIAETKVRYQDEAISLQDFVQKQEAHKSHHH